MNTNHSADKTLLLGHEYPQKDEDKIADEIIGLLKAEMLRLYASKKTKQLRQIHPKMNGCVKAEFIVEPNLPGELRVGLFKEARCFPAWIRFSNGKTKPLPDWKKDIRGFAIKIMNVPGEKLIDPQPGVSNQDFILMNTKNFVSGNVKHFAKILKVVTTPNKPATFLPKLLTAVSSFPILVRAAKAHIKINNPCEIPYFSTVPFRFGDESRAVKYAVIPLQENKLLSPTRKDRDLLRLNLAETLKQNEIIYDFCIQFQEDSVKMPIEDPTIVWDSPFIKLATIHIPAQEFDTPEQKEFGDNLSFNPWRCLPEHRPLGAFNRVRKKIYEEMYEFRHAHNNIPDVEPVATPDFIKETNLSLHAEPF